MSLYMFVLVLGCRYTCVEAINCPQLRPHLTLKYILSAYMCMCVSVCALMMYSMSHVHIMVREQFCGIISLIPSLRLIQGITVRQIVFTKWILGLPFYFLFFYPFIFILCLWVFCPPVCVYLVLSKARPSDLDGELQVFVSCHIDAEKQTWVFCKSDKGFHLLSLLSSLQSPQFCV